MRETSPGCNAGDNLVELEGRGSLPSMTLDHYMKWIMFPHRRQVSLVDLTIQEQPDAATEEKTELESVDVYEYCTRRGILGQD